MRSLDPLRPVPGTESSVVRDRVAAFALDLFVLHGVVAFLALALAGVGSALVAITGSPLTEVTTSVAGTSDTMTVVALGGAAFAVLTSLLTPVYFVLFEWRFGRTPGKMAMNLVVVDADGEPLGFRGALVRNLLRVVDSVPSIYLVGLGAIAATDRAQRVGDVVAGSVVVRAAPQSAHRTGTPTRTHEPAD